MADDGVFRSLLGHELLYLTEERDLVPGQHFQIRFWSALCLLTACMNGFRMLQGDDSPIAATEGGSLDRFRLVGRGGERDKESIERLFHGPPPEVGEKTERWNFFRRLEKLAAGRHLYIWLMSILTTFRP